MRDLHARGGILAKKNEFPRNQRVSPNRVNSGVIRIHHKYINTFIEIHHK